MTIQMKYSPDYHFKPEYSDKKYHLYKFIPKILTCLFPLFSFVIYCYIQYNYPQILTLKDGGYFLTLVLVSLGSLFLLFITYILIRIVTGFVRVPLFYTSTITFQPGIVLIKYTENSPTISIAIQDIESVELIKILYTGRSKKIIGSRQTYYRIQFKPSVSLDQVYFYYLQENPQAGSDQTYEIMQHCGMINNEEKSIQFHFNFKPEFSDKEYRSHSIALLLITCIVPILLLVIGYKVYALDFLYTESKFIKIISIFGGILIFYSLIFILFRGNPFLARLPIYTSFVEFQPGKVLIRNKQNAPIVTVAAKDIRSVVHTKTIYTDEKYKNFGSKRFYYSIYFRDTKSLGKKINFQELVYDLPYFCREETDNDGHSSYHINWEEEKAHSSQIERSEEIMNLCGIKNHPIQQDSFLDKLLYFFLRK